MRHIFDEFLVDASCDNCGSHIGCLANLPEKNDQNVLDFCSTKCEKEYFEKDVNRHDN